MGKINSKQKGARFEREIAKKFKERGFEAHRSQQFCGANGDADVTHTIDLGFMKPYIECKHVESLNLFKAMEQAKNDLKDESERPVVIHKKNNKGTLVTMELDDWLDLIEKFFEV